MYFYPKSFEVQHVFPSNQMGSDGSDQWPHPSVLMENLHILDGSTGEEEVIIE